MLTTEGPTNSTTFRKVSVSGRVFSSSALSSLFNMSLFVRPPFSANAKAENVSGVNDAPKRVHAMEIRFIVR